MAEFNPTPEQQAQLKAMAAEGYAYYKANTP